MINILPINDFMDVHLPTLYFDFNPSKRQNEWCTSALLKNRFDYESRRKRDIVVLYSRYDDRDKDFSILINNLVNCHHYAAVKIASKPVNASLGLFVVNPGGCTSYKYTTGNDQLFVIKADDDNNIIKDHKNVFDRPSLILYITLSVGFIDKRHYSQRHREYYPRGDYDDNNTNPSEIALNNNGEIVPYKVDKTIATPQLYEIRIYATTDIYEYHKISNVENRVDIE